MQETGPPRKNREGLRFIQRFYWRCKKNLRTLIPVLMIGIGVAFIYLAIYGSISFLGQNQNRSTRSDETHGQQIGSVKKFAGQTRKRMNNGFIWEEVRERDAAISNGDAVFTDSNSNVTLELSRVGELEVGENSLVVVDHTLNEEQVSLKIEQGKIKIRSLPSGKKIRIRSRGEVFEVQAKTADTDLSIDVGSDDSSNQVHFTSTRPDSIQVSDPRNEDRTKIVAAETPGNAPVDPPVVEIVGATAHSDPDGKISYQVSVQLKVKTRASAQYEIELFSRDRSLGKYRVVDDRYSLDLDSSGRYSIRARSLSSSGIIGAWSEPTIANVQPVPPIALDAKVTSSGPSPWVELTWKSQDKKVSEYVLKVWKGKQLFADRKIASESVILPVSEGADYQYTVASVDSESLISEESQPGQFSVKRLDTPQSEVESTPNAFDFAFGIMQMNYQQTNKPDVTSTLLVPRIMGNWSLGSGYYLKGEAYHSVAQVSTNQPTASLVHYGLSVDLGADTVVLSSPWKLSFFGGPYYFNTTDAGGSLGVRDYMGVELYPRFEREIARNQKLYSYVRFRPLMNHPDGMSAWFSNRMMSFGGGWIRPGSFSRTFRLNLDYTQFSLQLNGVTVQGNALGFEWGLMW